MNTMKIMLADADDDFRSLLAEAITRENDLEVCGNTGMEKKPSACWMNCNPMCC